MFKQVRFYRLSANSYPAAAVESALAKARFAACGATQKLSVGWVPPRGNEHDSLLENIGGEWILRLQIEKKSVPGSALREAVDQKCRQIEEKEGRKPGRKEKRELKEQAELELLPRAFSRTSTTTIWINRAAGLLVVGTASQSTCDLIVSQIIENLHAVLSDLTISPVDTNSSPGTAMTSWLMDYEAPENFALERTLELYAPDETKATVKYDRHNLDVGAVRDQLKAGMRPKRLAMGWDDKMSFVLGEDLSIKKIALIDATDSSAEDSGVDSFDADVSIMTGTLSAVLPDLVKALGGYSDQQS